jgi:hypothetical protein
MGFDIELTEALWVLNLLSSEVLPSIGVNALMDGIDNYPFRVLAGLSVKESDEAYDFFKQGLQEIGRGNMSVQEAIRVYARHISSKILSGTLEPIIGANQIWDAALNIHGEEFHDVDPFIYAASEYEERPLDRGLFDMAIREEAKEWVAYKSIPLDELHKGDIL